MSLLTYTQLVDLVDDGVLENATTDQVNAASIDLHLGDTLLVEKFNDFFGEVDLSKKESPAMSRLNLSDHGLWWLEPGAFALAETREIFHLPDWIACEFKLKSSLARAGLNHVLAGWADPGFNNATLTLELINALQANALGLKPGMKIGQMVFWEGERVPADASYAVRGRYNNQRGATESKGVV